MKKKKKPKPKKLWIEVGGSEKYEELRDIATPDMRRIMETGHVTIDGKKIK